MSDQAQKHLHCGRYRRYYQNPYHYFIPVQRQNFQHLNNHSPYHFHHHHNLHRLYHCQHRTKAEQRLHGNTHPKQIESEKDEMAKVRNYTGNKNLPLDRHHLKPSHCDIFNPVSNNNSINKVTRFLSILKHYLFHFSVKSSFRNAMFVIVLMFLNITQASSKSSSSSSQLCINVVVAQSCDESFLSSLKTKADKAIHDFQQKEVKTNNGAFQITFSVFPQCNTASVLTQLNAIFSNETTDVIVALASYDIHASFIPLAEIYQKAYIVGNNHMTSHMALPTFAPFPSFAQESEMLVKILDMYRWQTVYVIYTDFRYWLDFSVTLYFTLTSQKFLVRISKVETSVPEDLTRVLKDVGESKVLVLLMDVSDQQDVLAAASAMSMTTKHAIFSFTDSPYDVTSRSLVDLQSEDTSQSRFSQDTSKPDVSIFESVFVIASSFPKSGQSSNKVVDNDEVKVRKKRHAERSPLFFHSEKATGREFNVPPNRIQNNNIENVNDLVIRQRNLLEKSKSRISKIDINDESKPLAQSSLLENKIKKDTVDQDKIDTYYSDIDDVNNDEIPNLSNSLQKQRFGDNKIEKSTHYSGHDSFTQTSSNPIENRLDLDGENLYLSKLSSDNSRKSETNSELSDVDQSSSSVQKSNDPNTSFPKLGSLHSDLNDKDKHKEKEVGLFSDLKSTGQSPLLFRSETKRSNGFPYVSRDAEQLPSDTTEIESRSKRAVHNFKTVEADLDAVYDVIYLLSYVAYENFRRGGMQTLSAGNLISNLANVSFNGTSGAFDIDSELQVNFDFNLYDFNVTSGRFEPRIYLEAVSPSDWTVNQRQPISWPGRSVLPGDSCFKQMSNCDEDFQIGYIAAIVIATIALIFIVVFIISFIRRYWTNKEMSKGPNKILMQASDLVFIYKKDVGKSSRTMMKSRATLTDKENTPDIIRASDPTSRSMPSLNELTDFTQTARYNGDLVHVKELDIKGFEMKSKVLAYVRMLRDLRHENLNPFVGFLVEETKPAMVMEYCSRGSLHDMIHNDDIKLDWDFKLSLLTDLVRGIRYLHSSALKFHGHLTSHNCVIDSRFVLKVTAYGVIGLLERCKTTKTLELKDCMWSAPELLRDPVLLQKGTDKGDLYSMAIIFQEIALRSEPYSTTGLTPEEIVRKLKKPPPLIRPSVTPQAAPPQFIQIMKQCWSEMPEMRPSLDEVYDQFKKLTGGKKANIVDTMFKMLEKYSNDLEDIVAERTMQLEEEKKKTDQLLFRMLPPSVAESLKMGQTVEAETFSEVSIYFSDIVGFTTISAMSTPMQVVDLLNDLYTMFDATIDNYDVYKVETIGDAYMVASGLPIKNGNRHAGEISTMALMLLSQCGEFTIRHMPHVPLRLRIGLHTGSCVAGVVGLTMPRFCLFGDTVNTASRMESTGAAFRIHISEACKSVLDELGGYKVAFRGKTELKGKGKLNTYWLVGKEGLDKELPEPPPLIGNDTHGLESILRHMESDAQSSTPKPVGHVSPTKSCSAPDLVTPSTSPQPSNNTLLPVPDGQTSSSQPSNLDNLQTLHKETCKHSDQNRTSVVRADIHRLGCGQSVVGGVDRSPADEGLEDDTERLLNENNEANLVGMETGKEEYNNRHSESNDSGFGAERKHSQGQEFNSGFQTNTSDKVKRNSSYSSMTSNRTSVVSSSDVSLNHHAVSCSDGHDEPLAPVSEV